MVFRNWQRLTDWRRRSIVLSSLVVLLALGLFYVCSPRRSVTRVDVPMTLAQAKQIPDLADFPFPPTAQNIYYAGYADWIAHQRLIRFDASQQDCEAALPQILEWYEKERHWTYPTVALTNEVSLPAPDQQFLGEVKWWGGLAIKHGLFAGKDSSNMPQV